MHLPDELVDALNGLGFALIGDTVGDTFARPAIGGELYVTLEPVGHDMWRIGLKARPPLQPGRRPDPPTMMSLAVFGVPTDSGAIDMPTKELLATLPRLLGEAVLPAFDAASGEG